MITRHPYPGLRPFHSDESDIFFGREKQIDELLERLESAKFLAVIGPSGCGKSSLIRAGLIPALETGFVSTAGAVWRVAEMRPGNHPISSLAVSLLSESALGPERLQMSDTFALLNSRLHRGPNVLAEILHETHLPPRTNLLLLVDQFEEIFRYRGDENREEGNAFVNMLLRSAKMDLPLYTVITMRSDFLGDCTIFNGLPEAINESQFLTPRLTRDELTDAIAAPAQVFGRKVEPALVSRLLNDLGDEQDQLPVLQHVLMRSWEHEVNKDQSGALDMEDYRFVGKMDKALAKHANEAFDPMSKQDQRITKKMFQALTALDASNRHIRRPVPVSKLASVCGTDASKIEEIVTRFQEDKRNFLVRNRSKHSEEVWIDISHESLIRQWPRLEAWVKEEAESAEKYHFLAVSATRKDPLGERNVADYIDWKRTFKPNAAWAQRYTGELRHTVDFQECMAYLDDSVRKLARKKRLRRLAFFGILFAIVGSMVAFTVYTKDQERKAKREAATQERLADIQQQALKNEQRMTAELVSAQDSIIRIRDSLEHTTDSLERTLAFARTQTLRADNARDEADALYRKTLAQRDELRVIRDGLQATLAELRRTQRETDSLKSLAESRRYRTLVTNYAYRAELEDEIHEKSSLALRAYYLNKVYNNNAWNARIVEALWRSIDSAGTSVLKEKNVPGIAGLVAQDDDLVYVATTGQVFRVAANTSQAIGSSHVVDYLPNSLAINHSTGRFTLQDKAGFLYTVSHDSLARSGQGKVNPWFKVPYVTDPPQIDTIVVNNTHVRSTATGMLMQFRAGQFPVSCKISPSGRYFAVGMQDGWLYIIDLETRHPVLNAQYHNRNSRVSGIAFSPDEQYLGTVGLDGKILLNRMDQLTEVSATEIQADTWVTCITFPGDDTILIGTDDGQILKFHYDQDALAKKLCANLKLTLNVDHIDYGPVDAMILEECERLQLQ